jgi:hypothetical protein
MSAGDARHGRRDNGLVAAEYAAAGDVDPRVGEHLLDVLALDGIAAYLRPSTDLHPVTRSTILPSRPTDRLYVDRAHVATARDYLNRLAAEAQLAETDGTTEPVAGEPTGAGPAIRTNGSDPIARPDATRPDGTRADDPRDPGRTWLSGDEVDAAWAEIIAGYSDTAEQSRTSPDPGPTTTPAARPERGEIPAGPPPAPTRRPRRDPVEEPSLLDGLDTFGADLPDDENERFTPPVPPPVPRPSTPTVAAVIGIVAGLAFFINPALVSFMDESLVMFIGFASIVTGFGTLVWRLRPGDDDDDNDPDNGARV